MLELIGLVFFLQHPFPSAWKAYLGRRNEVSHINLQLKAATSAFSGSQALQKCGTGTATQRPSRMARDHGKALASSRPSSGARSRKSLTRQFLAMHNYSVDGWLSKLWSRFGYPKYQVPYYNRDPKRAHNCDNHPDLAARNLTILALSPHHPSPRPLDLHLPKDDHHAAHHQRQ